MSKKSTLHIPIPKNESLKTLQQGLLEALKTLRDAPVTNYEGVYWIAHIVQHSLKNQK